MAASPSVTDELTCSICLELFEEPVLLPCAHSFCRQCLAQFSLRQPPAPTINEGGEGGDGKGTEGKVITCPKCRAKVKLGPEGVAGLPKNTTLANIILSFEDRQQKAPPCDVCDSSPPRPGFRSCSDCTLTFCHACFAQLHPIRGAFTHHVITSPAPAERKASVIDLADNEVRVTRIEKRVPIGLHRVRSMSPMPKEQEYMERLRRSITRKRKELKEVVKEAQDLLKSTEDQTEEQMKQIRSVSSRLHEALAEREGDMLASCTRTRHETVTCCYRLVSDAQAQLLELDIVDEKFCQLLLKGPIMDISHELSCLQERLAVLSSTSLDGRLNDVPGPRQLKPLHVKHVLRDLDFKQETEVAAPVITDIQARPVAKGPAVIDIKWAVPEPDLTYRLTAQRKTQKGRTECVTVDDVTGGSQLMLLPGIDAQYRFSVSVMLAAKGESEHAHEVTSGVVTSEEKVFRTLPYVNCISLRFDPVYCHKLIAVTSSRDEVMHRKCKLSNLQDTYLPSTTRRLDDLEGAVGEVGSLGLPHSYWESVVHFHVISRLEDSKLICDLGVCKAGMEDACGLLCDNPKAYCCYLVRRGRFISLEFWNGPSQEILARSLQVADLERDTEKTLRLGFYLDAPRRVMAVVSPASGSILAQFAVKFASLVWLVGLYCPEQVYATVKNVAVNNIPTVVGKLVAKAQATAGAAGR